MNLEINVYEANAVDIKGLKEPYCRLQLRGTITINKISDGIRYLIRDYRIIRDNARSAIHAALTSATNRCSCMRYNKDKTCNIYVIEINA